MLYSTLWHLLATWLATRPSIDKRGARPTDAVPDGHRPQGRTQHYTVINELLYTYVNIYKVYVQ